MNLPTCTIERKYLSDEGFSFVVGIDEAGRGPLVGSVVAAAAMRKDAHVKIPEAEAIFIRDSKTLSETQREKAFKIVQNYFWTGVGECDNKAIDRMNILEAALFAMRKAVTQLSEQFHKREKMREQREFERKMILLVDGNKEINSSMAQCTVVGGDAAEQVIAAASIVAKVTRDREMRMLHELFPLYGFDKHKGYGTKAHMDALKKYGPTPLHRMSFRPVRESVTMERINREL